MVEIYACVDCGSTVVPGLGPDDIVETEDDAAVAEKEGACPSCDSVNPYMDLVAEV